MAERFDDAMLRAQMLEAKYRKNDPPELRYRRDPEFRNLVHFIRSFLQEGTYTPTEVREAVLMACIQVEESIIRDGMTGKVVPWPFTPPIEKDKT
jgi:hypothetical protein